MCSGGEQSCGGFSAEVELQQGRDAAPLEEVVARLADGLACPVGVAEARLGPGGILVVSLTALDGGFELLFLGAQGGRVSVSRAEAVSSARTASAARSGVERFKSLMPSISAVDSGMFSRSPAALPKGMSCAPPLSSFRPLKTVWRAVSSMCSTNCRAVS